MCSSGQIGSPLHAATGLDTRVTALKQQTTDRGSSLAAEFAAGWRQIFHGVVVAGSIYPILVATIYVGVGIVVSFVQRSNSDALLLSFSMFMAAIWYTVIVAVIGLLWAAVVCLAVFPVVYFFISSLDLRGSIVSLGAYTGGLVGFAAVLPFLMLVLVSEHSEGLWAGVLLLAFGPCLTTVLGQLGGAWGGRRATQSSDKWYLEQLAIALFQATQFPPSTRRPHQSATNLRSGECSSEFANSCGLRFGSACCSA